MTNVRQLRRREAIAVPRRPRPRRRHRTAPRRPARGAARRRRHLHPDPRGHRGAVLDRQQASPAATSPRTRPGVPLALRLTVIDATTCEPIPGADVEVWHADAKARTRATAPAPPHSASCAATRSPDANGRVRFDTIYRAGIAAARRTSTSRCTSAARSCTPARSSRRRDEPSRVPHDHLQVPRPGRHHPTGGQHLRAGGRQQGLATVTKRPHNAGYLAAMTLAVRR